jgi:hypothetical protein
MNRYSIYHLVWVVPLGISGQFGRDTGSMQEDFRQGAQETLQAMEPLVDSKKTAAKPLFSTDSQKRYEQLSIKLQEKSLNIFDTQKFNKLVMDVYQFADEYGREVNADQAAEVRRVLTTLRAHGASLSDNEREKLELDIRGAWLRAREKKNKIDQKWFGSRSKAQAYELYALVWNKLLEGLAQKSEVSRGK